ncbi:MAG: tannase/feruloyl esterase family alpha/beta hydrolase [Pseudomonadales bacterium]|jgi:feruloyl esterase|nr:tannase/feruloyl esterase family alpha/beta hydrolase [Pseudomonadales bacterium]MDP6470302.1 tannase/feruloyl esterase family alpha/beta hydrolase [Pseudomonadales bacterium]MDP6827208.1 tannase/feruloyl esterase family alpha/beta hydrolase [Pseudomonadales bacterium]MDP6972490.1 tannase/feruloyl esterase family alpha/beta hydrolase [Pseudomonadales bacterium]|tara:strand:- start:412 stop:2013 length:1602 start_codon:yes stop_codon:yes gene_type:complete
MRVLCLLLGLIASPALLAMSVPDARCVELADVVVDSVGALSTKPVRQSDSQPSQWPRDEVGATVVPVPDYCRVRGTLRPAIGFEVRLPLENWNGKFYMAGCGGFCGEVLPDRSGYSNAINVALARGYAVVTSDAGHWGESRVDAFWAYQNRCAEIDWAHRSIPAVTHAARKIVARFYGSPPVRSYFSGCSNGGRMGAIAMQRYPELFDGVIIGAPALDWRTLSLYSVAVTAANTDAQGRYILDHKKLAVLHDAVVQECDARDGLTDGLIADPRQCRFDARTLLCSVGENEGACLTREEVQTVEGWYAGLQNGHGVDWPFRMPQGSEPYWRRWYAPAPGQQGAGYLFSDGLIRYIMYERDPGPEFSPLDVDLDVYPRQMETMRQLVRADATDLGRFRDRGGKAILYQGYADPAAIPEMTIGYYEDVLETMGGQRAVDEFLRLFMIPGAGHCFEPPRNIPDHFDPLAALERWVERDIEPRQMIAAQWDASGEVVRSRPLCSYPGVARYRGRGNVDEAGSFVCVAPDTGADGETNE